MVARQGQRAPGHVARDPRPPHDDTIVAIATGAGLAAIGVVRLSGPRALAIGRALFSPSRAGAHLRPRRIYVGTVLADSLGDRALYFELPGPRSYTGQDMVELQAHGSPPLLATLVARAIALGAREARPGEFTERAFVAGKLDLLQVEALAALLDARHSAAQRLFARSVRGQLGPGLRALRQALVAQSAALEAAIDYPDDVALPDSACLVEQCARSAGLARRLLAGLRAQRRLERGLRVVVAGPPNAGKSSLVNALSGQERVLVDAAPGTTRDFVEVPVRLEELPLVLVDTAGLRAQPASGIEAAGIAKTLAALAAADLIVWLVPCDQDGPQALERVVPGAPLAPSARLDSDTPGEAGPGPLGLEAPLLLVASKGDLCAADRRTAMRPQGTPAWVGPSTATSAPALYVSSASGQGLDELRAALLQQAKALLPEQHELGSLTSARQERLVSSLQAHAEAALALLQAQAPGWPLLVSEELRAQQQALAELLGEGISEEVLAEIFSRFCIGK